MKLWNHQKEVQQFADTKDGVLMWHGMGCLSKDTELQIIRSGNGQKMTIETLYNKWHGSWKKRKCLTTIKALINKELRHSEIQDVIFSGHKKVYEITLLSGRSIKCTGDHRFRVKHNTWIHARDLTPEHKILVNGQTVCKKCGKSDHKIVSSSQADPQNLGICLSCLHLGKKNGQYINGKTIDNDGYVRLSGCKRHPRANTKGQVYEHIIVMEKHLNRYIKPDEIIHHLDENKTNNSIENLFLTNSKEHSTIHSIEAAKNLDGQRNKHGQTIHMIPKYDIIKSRKEIGIEPVYDITMKHTNNFVANKIVVHNSGKSFSTISIINKNKSTTTLIICPKTVLKTWIKEFKKYEEVDGTVQFALCVPLKGSVAKKTKEIEKFLNYDFRGKQKIVILNYEAIWRPGLGPVKDKWKNITSRGLLKNRHWDMVVCDECQKIKSPGSKVSRFVSQLKADKKLCLSGTPTPNSPLDIYAIFRFLDKSIFGTSYQRFKMRYAEWGGFENRQVVKYINQQEMNKKVYSITHRINTDDVIDLPPFQHIPVECELNSKTRKAYDFFKKEAIIEFANGEELTAANVLTKYLRLAQIASGTVTDDSGVEHHVDTSKIDALKDLLLGIDEPVVIFTRFKSEVTRIKEAIGKFKKQGERERIVAELTGDKDERDKFASGEAEIIIVNLQAGGVGVNELVRARYGIYFSTGYSSGDYEQSLARIRRPGSDINKTVIYYHITAKNTIDEVIMQAIDRKMNLIEAVLQDFSKAAKTTSKAA